MAAGAPLQANSPDRLRTVMGTLKDCLTILTPTPCSSENKENKENKENIVVIKRERKISDEIVENANGLMPDGTQWPHDQHNVSNDDCLGSLSERIRFVQYRDENQIADVMRLMTKDLSEPYSIYTYRFFVHNWPELCILAFDCLSEECVGAVVGKLEQQPDGRRKGYVAMLAVDESCRRMGLGTKLVRRAIDNMRRNGCDEVYLETEVSNTTAQGLYAKLGFIRDKRLIRYYLNGNDAFRLKLFFAPVC